MIEDITSAVSGILTALASLVDPSASSSTGGTPVTVAAPYIALLALPVLGGTVAFARKLIKKAR